MKRLDTHTEKRNEHRPAVLQCSTSAQKNSVVPSETNLTLWRVSNKHHNTDITALTSSTENKTWEPQHTHIQNWRVKGKQKQTEPTETEQQTLTSTLNLRAQTCQIRPLQTDESGRNPVTQEWTQVRRREMSIRSSKQVWKTPEIVGEPRRERVNATWTDHREQTEVENTFRRETLWAETFKKTKQRASWILPPASHAHRSEHHKITRKHTTQS